MSCAGRSRAIGLTDASKSSAAVEGRTERPVNLGSRPLVIHAGGPTSVPVFPSPISLAALVPLPSSKSQYSRSSACAAPTSSRSTVASAIVNVDFSILMPSVVRRGYRQSSRQRWDASEEETLNLPAYPINRTSTPSIPPNAATASACSPNTSALWCVPPARE